MPGSSLWLLPPSSHPLSTLLESLIQNTSSQFSPPHHLFIPHITLTSDIPPSSHEPDAQEWLDALKLPPATHVTVRFGQLQSEDIFYRKLYVNVVKDGVCELARIARTSVDGVGEENEHVASMWVERFYRPHLSLLYHDCPKLEMDDIRGVNGLVRELDISLEGKGELGGWTGGRVVLVPTSRPVWEWVPIAGRTL